jgi:transporter family protein
MAIVVTLFTLFISKKVQISSFSELPISAWIFITLSAVCGALSWLLFFQALSIGPAQGVTVLDKLSLIFTLILAALFLGESFTFQTIIGGLFVLLGTLLVALPWTQFETMLRSIGFIK